MRVALPMQRELAPLHLQPDLERCPMRWQPGRQRQGPRSHRQSQQRFHCGAVQPRRRTCVPAPAAAPRVRRRAVDVPGSHIGLQLVRSGALGLPAAVCRADRLEAGPGRFAVATERLCHQSPDGGMRILPAVLPHPRRIRLDIAGVVLRMLQWRRQQQQQTRGGVDQLLLDRRHCRAGKGRRGGT